MRRLAFAAVSSLVLAGCSSGGGLCDCTTNQVCVRGRCIDTSQQTPFEEPVAAAATCAEPQQVVGPALTLPPTVPDAQGACALPPPQPSAAPPERVQRLGQFAVGTSVQFQVPAGAAGFAIVLQAVTVPVTRLQARTTSGALFSFDNTAVPLRVTAPDGQVWYDDVQALPVDLSTALVYFGSQSPSVGTLGIPNTARALDLTATAGLPGGIWTLVVNDFAHECAETAALASFCGAQAGLTPAPDFQAYRAGVYDVSVVTKAGPRAAQGTLDVGFYLHPCPGADYDGAGNCLDPRRLSAATAASDPDLQRMLRTFTGILGGAGLCLGTVTWYDLPQWAVDRWKAGLDLDATGCEVQLGQLLAISAPNRSEMSLFLVPEIVARQDGTTSQVVGLDGTIPGPASLSGTVQSGAAVSSANLRAGASRCTGGLVLACGADVTAYIAAHETGHYLGLYHTTEQTGDLYDPLSDTPVCQCSCEPAATTQQCASGSVEVRGTSCVQSATCGGGRNLMFWLLDQVSQGKVSPQQSEVAKSNPLVR